jgi:hypothetical protein
VDVVGDAGGSAGSPSASGRAEVEFYGDKIMDQSPFFLITTIKDGAWLNVKKIVWEKRKRFRFSTSTRA